MPSPASCSADNTESIYAQIETNFKIDVIKETLKGQFTNPKNKISEEALELMSELLKALVTEASIRSAKQCTLQNKAMVTLADVESILPQLMLDFP